MCRFGLARVLLINRHIGSAPVGSSWPVNVSDVAAGFEGFAEEGVLGAEALDLGSGELEAAGQRAVGPAEPGVAGG
jgi:hypothetical protein